MDTELLVEPRIEDGRKLLGELVRDGFDVTVAVWVRTSEEASWSLTIGSNSVTPEKSGEAYGTLYVCLSRLPDSSVSLSEVKLVQASDPIARDAVAVRERHPGFSPIRYNGKRLGNLAIEEAYIYPRIGGPMTPSEVLQTVLALMNRMGHIQPAVVTLRDGSTIRAIPTGIRMRQPSGAEITLLDASTNSERSVRADEVVNMQEEAQAGFTALPCFQEVSKHLAGKSFAERYYDPKGRVLMVLLAGERAEALLRFLNAIGKHLGNAQGPQADDPEVTSAFREYLSKVDGK